MARMGCIHTLALLCAVALRASAQTCRPAGARCIGAPGFPAVPWVPCCSGGCDTTLPGEWGTFCAGAAATQAPAAQTQGYNGGGAPAAPLPPSGGQCHADYARCAGAPGKPFVEWKLCCGDGAVCDSAPDWGSWCIPQPGGGAPAVTEPPVVTVPGEPAPKDPVEGACHAEYTRCEGAAGKPFVQWKPCCQPGASCVAAPDWGKWCKPGDGTVVVTSAPTVEPPADPTCHANGVRCQGAPGKPFVLWKPCCVDGDVCQEDVSLGWGSWCIGSDGPAVTTAVPPVQTTTVAPVETTTVAPVETTTVAPVETTTMTPVETTTMAPEETTTMAPVETTTMAPVETITMAPEETTTMAPEETTTTTEAPVETTTTTAAPEETTTTTEAPVETTTTTEAPVETTTTTVATTTTVPDTTTASPDDVCEGLNSVRPDITTMSDTDWNNYVEAVKLLREKPGANGISVLENFAEIHAEFGQHFGAYFAPWHRAMLWEFEKELESVKPGTRVPTYDWSVVNLNALDTSTFSPSRLGNSVSFNGDNSQPIPNGPFQGLTSRASGSEQPVMRDFDRSVFLPARETLDIAITSLTVYSSFAIYLEGAHNSFHIQMGGSMNSLSFSPDEPGFYIHHAFIDKLWREWQQIGNSNKFGGTHPAADGEPVDLDATMQPFGRTVREILEGISGCVEYTDASARPGFSFGISSRQDGAGAEDITGEKRAPKQVEAAGEQTAFIDSLDAATAPKLGSKEEKFKILEEVADKKVADPAEYRQKVLVENKVVTDSVQATASLGAPVALQELLKKTMAFVEMKNAVDLTDVFKVFEETEEEIVQDGEAEKKAIVEGNEEALPPKKLDLTGEQSDVAVAVEGER